MNRFTFAGLMLFALLLVAPIASAQEGSPGCPWGYYYNPITHDYVLVCVSQPADNAAALKPAGLAAPAPVVAPEQGSRCVSYAGPNYSVCVVASSGASAAAKSAGLAAPAQATQQDPTMDWISSQERNATLAAAGLANVASAVASEQGSPCGVLESIYSAGYIACVDANRGTSAALKPAGLAKLAPVEAFVPCGYGERLDPLALACLRQPAASGAAKPAGPVAPTHERLVTCDTGESPDPLVWPQACLR